MRIEIHRHRMIMRPREDGMIAVGYDVLVPEDDCLPGAGGVVRILSPGWRQYRSYEDATWTCGLPRGCERYAKWLDHEKAAQREMLAMVQERCPETRGWTRWPMFWGYVKPGSDLDTVCFTIEQPASAATAETTRHATRTPAA